MYLPKQFAETRTSVLHGLMRERPFATLVVMTDEGLSVDHIPLLVDEAGGSFGVLRGHVARANPILKAELLDTDAVAIFHGPDHYITPSWYPTKQETGKVVPTWNYVVVHAYGRPKFIDDEDWLRQQVNQLTRQQEAHRDPSWAVADAPEDFVATQLRGIVGIEMPIARLVGKWKLGQNRAEGDRLGVIEGLRGESGSAAEALAGLTERSMRGPRITLGPVQPDDFEELVSVRIEAMRESLERIGRFDAQRARERLLEGFAPECTRHILVDGQRVGFVTVKPGTNVLNLEHFYIRPGYQGRGIGSLVLSIVFDEADRLGLPLRVGALRGSDSNRFYSRHGFVRIEETEWDIYYLRSPAGHVSSGP